MKKNGIRNRVVHEARGGVGFIVWGVVANIKRRVVVAWRDVELAVTVDSGP